MPENTNPLEAITQLEAAAFRAGQLARNLIATHPDAGLTVTFASAFGHTDGEGTASLQLRAATVEGAKNLATAIGLELHTSVSAPVDPSRPLEFVRGRTVMDAIEVEVSGWRRLTDDEAAAWRAQQDQAAEDGEGTC